MFFFLAIAIAKAYLTKLHIYTQFSLTPEKFGLVYLSVSVSYITLAPIIGKIADKMVKKLLQ